MRQGRSDICGSAGQIYAVVQVRYMRKGRSDICGSACVRYMREGRLDIYGRVGQITTLPAQFAAEQIRYMWQGRADNIIDFSICGGADLIYVAE